MHDIHSLTKFSRHMARLYTSLTENILAADLTKKASPDRSKIAMQEELEIKYWTKHLDVSRDDLQRAVDKVGNSAAAVRKELHKG
jgi:Protein of unknown function (DUF3606)